MKALIKIVFVLSLVLLTGCQAFVAGTRPDCKIKWEPSSVVGVTLLGILSAAAVGVVATSIAWEPSREGKLIPVTGP